MSTNLITLNLKKTLFEFISLWGCILLLASFITSLVVVQKDRVALSSKITISTLVKKNHKKATPKQAVFSQHYKNSKIIRLKGAHDLIITGQSISGGLSADIVLYNCYNIKIIHNKLLASSETGISLYNCYNITIQNNYFTNVSTGVYAENDYRGNIIVDHNQFLNMQGPYPRGQCVQFNNINGPGNQICYNRCENILGKSNPEDAINLYKSNGTINNPIIVKENWIRGGGPSKSGGGIMLGDNGGSYQTAIHNILVDPGQYGIAISGGNKNAIISNLIYARAQKFTNVGIYVAGYNGAVCTNSIVTQNKVNYFNNMQKPNHSWIGPNTSKPIGWESNTWGANIGPYLLPRVIIH